MNGRSHDLRSTSLIAVLVLATWIPGARTALAGPTDLLVTWAANSEPDIAGYRISYGIVPGWYPTVVDAGNVTALRVGGLTTGQRYYFVVEAYDGAGNYSPPSAEASGVPGGGAAPALGLSVTDSPDPVAAGANLTYTLAYANTGGAAASGVTLTSSVPANTTFVSATGGGALAGSTVTWNLGTVAAGGSGSVQVVVRVASPLANGTNLIAGTAVIDSAETVPVTAASISTTVASSPALSIAAADAPDPVAAGANLTYTLTYANGGNAVATQTVATALLPANTTFVSATGGGVHGGGTVTWSVGTLGTGVTGSVQLVARVATPLPTGTVLALATYSIDCNQTSPVAGPAVTTAVLSNPVLSLAVTDSPDPVLAGADLTYTLAYANSGNAPATGATITAAVPAGTTFVSATAGGAFASGLVSWPIGTIGAGATGVVQMVVRVPSSAASGSVITAAGFAIDAAETAPAAAGTALTVVTVPSAPVVTAAFEATTSSIYLVRGAQQTLVVTGSAFAAGAVLNLGADVTVGPATTESSARLTAPVTIAPGATLGVRTVTLTNPDGRSGSLPGALAIVKKPDGNNDCKIDGVDLNRMARSWSSASGEAAFAASVDLDGDDYVGPDDLAVFVEYFAGKPHGCP